MRPVSQTILHDDPAGRPGNCLQAAIASLLELPLDEVPHFILHEDWLERLAEFCLAHGYQPIMRNPDAPVAYGMAWGLSERGVRHAVVWIDGEIAWDPHPTRAGLLHVTELIALEPVPPTPQGPPPMDTSPQLNSAKLNVFWPPPAPPLPHIGQQVFYRLSAADVRAITRQRAAAHIRATAVRADDVYPAVTVRVTGDDWDAPCNLQVALDGPDTFWAQQVVCGTEAGTWAWPANGGA
ncbi:hypothetical protein [Streptomyces fagopyri]|uniref:hypothetical protein n=1 Tax=Streptomyces fagopyri TaxID=2662397 RepID=UPI0038012C8A